MRDFESASSEQEQSKGQKGNHKDSERNFEYATKTFKSYKHNGLTITLTTPEDPVYLLLSWKDIQRRNWGYSLTFHQNYAEFIDEVGRLLRKFLALDLLTERK